MPDVARGVFDQSGMPHVSRGDFAGRNVALPLWIYVSGPPAAGLSRLREFSADGSLLQLRRYRAPAGAMRLTPRSANLLVLLSSARWLTTSQVHRRYFKGASFEAARKCLRKLERERYVFRFRRNPMMESLFSLG